MRFKLIISYDGSKFYGFQRQSKLSSVQQTIEEVLSETLKEKITIHGAGRTDALVHAVGQVIDFKTTRDIKPRNLKDVLNKKLAPYIYVKEASVVEDSFHSRINAVKKEYHYLVSTNEYDPTKADYMYFIDKPIDEDILNKAMKEFIGLHDFRSVCKSQESDDCVREIYEFSYTKQDGIYIFTIIGNGFLRNMVRVIIEICLRAATYKIKVEDVSNIINSKSRSKAPYLAKAGGLYLYKVYYE